MNTVSKTIVNFAAFAVIASGLASAQVADRVKVEVPFAFQAGDQILPAGTYTMGTDYTKVVWVRDAKGYGKLFLQANNGDKPKSSGLSSLTFRVHDGRYYLASMWIGDTRTGRQFNESKKEREVENASAHTTYATLIALK